MAILASVGMVPPHQAVALVQIEQDTNYARPNKRRPGQITPYQAIEANMNYIQMARGLLSQKIEVEADLLDLYTLLVFATGADTDLAHVHDAWAIWRNRTDPTHESLLPFSRLSRPTQERDRKYVEAIRETAREIAV